MSSPLFFGWLTALFGLGLILALLQILRQRAQHAKRLAILTETAERHQCFADASFEAIFLSENGRCLAQNLTAERMFGYTDAEARGRLGTAWIIPEDRENVMEKMVSGSEELYQVTALRKDGSTFPCEIQGMMIEQADGRQVRVTALRDITPRRELELQLRLAQKMEAIGRLAGGVAHDFNNILQAIVGYVDLLKGEIPAEEGCQRDLGEIKAGAERAAALTRQLLAFGSQQVVTPVFLDPNREIGELLRLLRRVIGEDVQVDFLAGSDLGAVRVDSGQFEQILLNLCLNARDAIEGSGNITITTRGVTMKGGESIGHSVARPGRYVLIEVADTGQGMDAATVEHVFEPFFTTKDPGKGAGLGLSTVFGIIEQYGGMIDLHSKEGEGTTVCIYLGRLDPGPVDSPPGDRPSVTGGGERILVAEDDASIRHLTERVLSEAGYDVVTVADGQSAVDRFLAEDGDIDLALFDLVMPHMSGQAAARVLRTHDPDFRVIYMSGYGQDRHDDEFEHGESIALLQKPCSPDMLLRMIRTVLDDSRKPKRGPINA